MKKKINHQALSSGRKPAAFSLFALLLFFGCFFPALYDVARAADKSEDEILKEQLQQREEKLWQNANKDFQAGKNQEAAGFFLQYYKQYPDSPRAEEALWKSANLQANLQRQLALDRPDADWEKVQELFRSFTINYPQSPHLPDAYYEVANAYYQMRFYREALTYLGLFINRFADSPRSNEALYMKARIFLQIGRLEDAAEVYRELGQSGDEVDKLRGQAGLAHIDFANGKYHDALGGYLKILKKRPSYYIDYQELLHNKGLANLRVGNLQEGRKDLLQYLNITGDHASRLDTLYELAESYMADGDRQMAKRFYEQVIEEGEKDERVAVLMSRLRLAQEASAVPETQRADKKEKVVSPEDDKPFQDVLDLHYQDPSSQDARFEMVRRYWERKEYDQAYNMGKAYLRFETVEAEKKEVVDIMGQILARRMNGLFQDKKFAAIYQIYKDEYPYVKLYGRATLLFLTGRALEEMGLYRQAGVIYYRAMALELTDEEQLDLYIQRVQTYLADNDIKSAQRLLKYLRKIYAADAGMGEVCSLSGHLREKQNRSKDALKFYQIAVEKPTFAEKKNIYAADYLRLLLELDEILEKAAILDTFQRGNWLTPQELQYWYGKLAERYWKDNNLEKARDAYLAAVAEKMPQNNETAQMLQLNLGDVLLLLGKRDEAKAHFRRALEGANSLVKKLAQQRLTQEDINRAMADTEAVMKN
ncbi:MAG: tetratricopeptide repeat protein [Desulfobulbaceae bacterium]|nr:tetratricopeptide repeat protein [Desulfobulbaceae bacterium]